MTCNLAVSIARAAITERRLRSLLVPDTIRNVVLTYLRQQYAAYSPVLLPASGDVLRYRIGTMLLTIVEGEVTVSEPGGDREQAEQLATKVSELLAAAANRLFQQQVQQALKAVTTRGQTVNVTFEGRSQQAAVFHINL
jgi:hypothetical protein